LFLATLGGTAAAIALDLTGARGVEKRQDVLVAGLAVGVACGVWSFARGILNGSRWSRTVIMRSPIEITRGLNKTKNKKYWDAWGQEGPHRALVGAEIGVYRGDHAESILRSLCIRELHLIDPYEPYMEYETGIIDSRSFHEDNFSHVCARFAPDERVVIHRCTSELAVSRFPNESFDFIYIDGDHAYEKVKFDLEAWWPKLKIFGVLGGDDFGHCSGHGVIRAVSEFSFERKVPLLFGRDRQFTFIKYR